MMTVGLLNVFCFAGSAEEYFINGIKEDRKGHSLLALNYFIRACNHGHDSACLLAGSAYQTGKGISKNYSEAAKLYKRACELGNATGCGMYASIKGQEY